MYDVIIIGAGPIGSYIARRLAAFDYKVLVIDRTKKAGYNVCCTGIISRECLDLLNINHDIKTEKILSTRIVAPANIDFRIYRKESIAYVVDRPGLNKVLSEKSILLGAEYAFSSRVIAIDINPNNVLVNTVTDGKEKHFEAKMAVITSGFNSKLIHNLNLGKIKNFLCGVQTEVPTLNCSELEIYLDHSLAPGGFAWQLPIWNNLSLVGLVCKSFPKKYLEQLLIKLQVEQKIYLTNHNVKHGLIPLEPLPKTYGNRFVVIGEAAGQVKPTTGGGIYYGILCADIAFNVINEAFQISDFSERQLKKYSQKWHARLSRELLFGRYMQSIFTKMNNTQIKAVTDFAIKIDLPERLGNIEKLPFDWHSQVVFQLMKQFIPFFQ